MDALDPSESCNGVDDAKFQSDISQYVAEGDLRSMQDPIVKIVDAPIAASESPSLVTHRSVCQVIEQLILQNKFSNARSAVERYLDNVPEDPAGWILLGLALRGLGKPQAAISAYRRALELAPDRFGILTNLGNALKDAQRLDEAIAVHSAAVNADPGSVANWMNLGVALRERGELHGALAAFDRVRALVPDDVNGHWDRAQVLLMLGRYAEGWAEFEWRWQLPGIPMPNYAQPRWKGEFLPSATVLLWPEQGFGDSILATRYLPEVKRRVGRIILGCRHELASLFRGLPGVDHVVTIGETIPHFDVHAPLLSLPGIFSTNFASIPFPLMGEVPIASRQKLAPVIARAGKRLKVGIVWSGSTTFKGNHLRAATLMNFLTLAEVPGVQLFSLQKGPNVSDLDEMAARHIVIDLDPFLEDFSDTAAAVDALDLVIMTDSSVAHLAGSRGRPIWNLLAYVPYWLYLRDRCDSPWYPSMRLFRQPAPADWTAVFCEVRSALAVRVAAGNA